MSRRRLRRTAEPVLTVTTSPLSTRAPLHPAGASRLTGRGGRVVRATARRARAPRIRGWASTERVAAGRAARTSDQIAEQRTAGGALPAREG